MGTLLFTVLRLSLSTRTAAFPLWTCSAAVIAITVLRLQDMLPWLLQGCESCSALGPASCRAPWRLFRSCTRPWLAGGAAADCWLRTHCLLVLRVPPWAHGRASKRWNKVGGVAKKREISFQNRALALEAGVDTVCLSVTPGLRPQRPRNLSLQIYRAWATEGYIAKEVHCQLLC